MTKKARNTRKSLKLSKNALRQLTRDELENVGGGSHTQGACNTLTC